MRFPIHAGVWPAFFSVLPLVFGCAGRRESLLREERYPSGKPRYRVELDSAGRKQGHETWWYENGTRKYEGENDRGLRNGMFEAWYPDSVPWYRGREDHGVPVDSLVYWYPNGRIRTVSIFRDGVPVLLRAFDSVEAPDTLAAARLRDSLQSLRRLRGIGEWSGRVRAAVEAYWALPKELTKNPYRASAALRLGRSGDLRSIRWIEKSPSPAFNNMAAKALKSVKRFPPFPASVPDTALEIKYEFVTPGKSPKRRRLELKGIAEPDSGPPPGAPGL